MSIFFDIFKETTNTKDGLSELNLNAGKEFFLRLFSVFPVSAFLTTTDGKILMSNAQMEQMFGYSHEEFLRRSSPELYADQNVRKELIKIFLRDGYVRNFPATLKKCSGEPLDVSMNIVGVHEGKEIHLLGMMENVSAIKDIKKELAEAKEKFAFLYQNSNDAIMQLSPPDWQFTAGNPATIKMFQVKSEEEFVSLAPWELSPEYQPDGQRSSDKAKAMIDKAIKEGSNSFEWTHKRYKGDNFPVEVFLIRMEVRGSSFLQAIVRDISEQKKAVRSLEAFIQKTKERISIVLPDIENALLKKGGENQQCNDQLDCLLSSIDSIVSVMEDKTAYLENVRKTMVSLSSELSAEKDKLSELNVRLETTLKSIGDGVFVVDKTGIVTFGNPAVAEITGYDIEEVIGKKCCTALRFYSSNKELEVNTDIKETMSSGVERRMPPNAVLQKKNGQKIPVSAVVSPMRNNVEEVIGCVVVFSDMTKERGLDKAKTGFVSLASHQLRTPLSTILWYIEMLLSGDVGGLEEKQREYLEDIQKLCVRMTSMVVALLNTAKIEMGTFAIKPMPINIFDSLMASFESMRPIAEKKNIFLEKRISPEVPTVAADPKLLGIVFDNLFSNAINYTLNGGHILVSIDLKDDDIVISVADDGIGILPEDKEKVFAKLFRSDNAKETDVSGTGIGLYLTKSLVESWNGSIYCESPQKGKEKGTTFFVTIPISGMKERAGKENIISN